MNKKQKLQELYSKLDALQNGTVPTQEVSKLTDDLIGEEIATLTARIKGNPTIKILQKFSNDLNKFKKANFTPVVSAIRELQAEVKQFEEDTLTEFENKLSQSNLTQFASLKAEFNGRLDGLNNDTLKEDIKNIQQQLQDIVANDMESDNEAKKEVEKSLENLRKEILQKFSNIGGGSMNRQIFIGGVDPLKRYTDINFKAAGATTITYANNDTTKKVDVTISSSATGGGIVRSILSVAIPTTAGAAAGTDYVYLVSGTTQLTLPTAVGNTNLYTIKNVGVGVVTIATTSSQTIDGNLTITMPVQYTSVDVESDGANWNIT